MPQLAIFLPPRRVHLGLGAGLREASEARPTKHHLDIVMATGRLAGATDRAILSW